MLPFTERLLHKRVAEIKTVSLNRKITDFEGQVTDLAQNVEDKQSPTQRFQYTRTEEVRSELRSDIQVEVSKLDPPLQQICECILRDQEISTVHSELTISESTLYRRMTAIRETMSESILRSYL